MNVVTAVTIWAIPVLVAITFHEAAHGYVAWRLGDDTAKRMGRVTFNPLRHIDPLGTVLIPAMLLILSNFSFAFGWAKPVPVDFDRLNNPRRDMVWVAAAGPGINIALAVLSAFLLHAVPLVPPFTQEWMLRSLVTSVQINLVLAVFNMIPLPPLDGGRVAVGLLPRRLARPLANMERFGLLVIIGAMFVLPLAGRELDLDLDVFRWLVGGPVHFLSRVIIGIVGLA